jgi:hypothetical protein
MEGRRDVGPHGQGEGGRVDKKDIGGIEAKGNENWNSFCFIYCLRY